MKTALAIVAAVTFLSGAAANAASLCNCCEEDTAYNCMTACAPIQPAPGQCIVAINLAGEAVIGSGQNPLYDFSLRNVSLEPANGNTFEVFRRLLEKARKSAEADRKSALRASRTGKIDQNTARSLAIRYDDAAINYYLGIQAYRLAVTGSNQRLHSSR